jgi:hypothetical protein
MGWKKYRASAQKERAVRVLRNRQDYPSERAWLDAVLAALPAGDPLQADTLQALEIVLRPAGSEYTVVHRDPQAHVDFWSTLGERHTDVARLRGLLADTLVIAGRTAEALPLFVETFERDPTQYSGFDGSVHDLIKDAGGPLWLRDRLALFRRELDALKAGKSGAEEAARDLYHELLEEFRDDANAVHQIQALAPPALKR